MASRAHWSIENNLHLVMDVGFKGDASRNRKDNYAANLHLIRQISLILFNLIQLKNQLKLNVRTQYGMMLI